MKKEKNKEQKKDIYWIGIYKNSVGEIVAGKVKTSEADVEGEIKTIRIWTNIKVQKIEVDRLPES